MLLVILAVAWPVTSVCDHHDVIGMRETLARVDHPIFTSRVQPGSPTASESRWWKCSRAGTQSAESDQGRV